VFTGTLDLIHRLRRVGIPVELVTESRHATALLDSARLRDVFDVVVDGTVADELGLPGRPDPATILETATTGVTASTSASTTTPSSWTLPKRRRPTWRWKWPGAPSASPPVRH
jgi:hypothetical protein